MIKIIHSNGVYLSVSKLCMENEMRIRRPKNNVKNIGVHQLNNQYELWINVDASKMVHYRLTHSKE